MKLSVVRGGGIAGLSTRTEVSTDALSEVEARALRSRVDEAGVLGLPDDGPAGAQHPEDMLYELTVEDAGRVHRVRFTESRLPDRVRSLITWADSLPKAEHTIDTPG